MERNARWLVGRSTARRRPTRVAGIVAGMLVVVLLAVSALPAAAAPANDNFNTPRVLRGERVRVIGTTSGATRQTGEPDHYTDPVPGDAWAWEGDHSVWFRWKAPRSGNVTINTCTAHIDSILAVYTGNNIASLTRVTDNNNACPTGFGSKVTFGAQRGGVYRIAVGDAGGARENSFTLRLKFV